MNSGSLWYVLNVSMRTSSNSNFFSKRQVRTLATSVDAGWPNTCKPAAMLPFDLLDLLLKLWNEIRDDDNRSHYQVFKGTKKMKCLPCYLTPHKWKRESVKAKGKVWILACNNHFVSTSKQCIYQTVIFILSSDFLQWRETSNIWNRSLGDCTMHRRPMIMCYDLWELASDK